jgi:2'-5' RNA ligase
MGHVVLAYPQFTDKELAWIEAIRTTLDPQAELIAPHVTLVFPIAEYQIAVHEVILHTRAVALDTPPFVLNLRCALVMPDIVGSGAHLFLVPDEGMSHFVKIHDQLYRGPLAPYLRLDIPFIPHITVGTGPDAAALYQVAQELNESAFAPRALIDRLTVVHHTPSTVTTVEEVTLAGEAT